MGRKISDVWACAAEQLAGLDDVSPVRAPLVLLAAFTLPLVLSCATPQFVVPSQPAALEKFEFDRLHCDLEAGSYSGLGFNPGQQLLALAYGRTVFKKCMLDHGYQLAGKQQTPTVPATYQAQTRASFQTELGFQQPCARHREWSCATRVQRRRTVR